MGSFLDIFKSEDGKSSVLDTAEDILSVASFFVPQAAVLKTVVGVVDSIVDPDNKEDKLSNYDVMGILTAVSPSVANNLNKENLSKIASALGVAEYAAEKYIPNSKVVGVLENIHEIVDPDNKTEKITNEDILGIVAKVGISKHNGIQKETLSVIKNILGE